MWPYRLAHEMRLATYPDPLAIHVDSRSIPPRSSPALWDLTAPYRMEIRLATIEEPVLVGDEPLYTTLVRYALRAHVVEHVPMAMSDVHDAVERFDGGCDNQNGISRYGASRCRRAKSRTSAIVLFSDN